jgi:VIT1/CCC1 family predicted Fe2+/Mn2+ transporter
MAQHDFEPHDLAFASKLNWLRAGVLGANDGIVSVAALLVGVAAATTDSVAILIAGIASVAAGATSMALGEYVSVSSQRDSERALINKERRELAEMPDEEFEELVLIYQAKGLTPETARQVATELTEHDVLRAHLEAELHISEDQLTNPWHAAMSSAISFLVGAALPLATVLLSPVDWRIPATVVASLEPRTWAAASQAEAFAAALQATQGKPGAKAPALATAPAGPAASQGSPKGPAGAKPPTVSQDASEVLASAPGTVRAADDPMGVTTEGFHGSPAQPGSAGGLPMSPEVLEAPGGRGMEQLSKGN